MYTYYPDQWLRAWFLGGPNAPTQRGITQLGQGSKEEFINGLGEVWKAVADACRPGARLAVRFGALPSVPVNPQALLVDSLARSDRAWRVLTVAAAGRSSRGKRQAAQFGEDLGKETDEIDLYARLEA
jgi:hypothetical protein